MSAKLFITDSGSPEEGIPSIQFEVVSPFVGRPLEQDDIKNVGLFQIQIEKTYQTFAVGKIQSLWEWELEALVEDSMTQEQKQDDLENLRDEDDVDRYEELDFSKDFIDEIKDDQIIEKLRQEELEEYIRRGVG